jgi:hypothetical protein
MDAEYFDFLVEVGDPEATAAVRGLWHRDRFGQTLD